MEKLRIMSVFGTRPEAIKMCPLVQELANREGIESLCCVTAQHRQMLDSVLEVFQVKPDWDLDIMTPRQTLSTITSKCLTGMDEAIDALKPDMILVHGDTSTTFAGALSAFYHQVSVGHVEAGLRTYDKYSPFPEEMNRKLVSAIADLYFCPTANNRANLEREGITKGLFVTAVALFSAGTVVGALAVNFPMLLAARLIMALGTGVSLPLLTNIILEKAPFNRRGMMLGLVSLVTCAAPAIGPVFGGLVMEFLNWHWIFYTMIPFLLISLVLGCATVPDIRHGGKGHLSVPSLVLVAAGLAGIIVAASFFAQWNGDWRFWTVLVGAIGVLGVFAAVQLKMEHPLVEVRTFAFPGFTLGMLILLMSSGGVLGVNFLLPILLQRGLGHTSMIAALILLPGAVVGAISAPLIGGALKAHFPPKFIACGFVGVAIMDIVMMLGGAHEWAVAIAYALFMAASGFVLVPDQTHALNQLPAAMNADGSAVMNTVQQLAGAIGTAVASTLIAEFSAANRVAGMKSAAAYVAGFSTSMWVFFGMAVTGEILALLMFRFSKRAA